MKVSLSFGFLFTVVTLTISLLTACGRSPLVRPETSASQTEIAAETGEAISPVVPATKIPETPTSTPSLTATVQTSPVSEADASPSSEPPLTPTAKPLSPLDERLGTIVFSTVGEKGPEIWRVQVDEQGQKAGPTELVDFPVSSRTGMPKLYASPDGKRIIVEVASGGEGSFLYVLDPATGQLTSLFAGRTDITDPRVVFLDWADSQNILIMGISSSELRNSAWLVDINNHTYRDVNIKQVDGRPRINSASFFPNGKAIVYSRTDCYECGSEIWRVDLDKSEQQQLFKDETARSRIGYVLWSPAGGHIAFVRWSGSTQLDETGQLYIMKTDGSENHLLSPAVILTTHPSWSPNGQYLAFIMSENSKVGEPLEKLSGNLYVVDILSNELHQLTKFQDVQVLTPTWSPDGSQITFLAASDDSSDQFKSWIATVQDHQLHQLEVDGGMIKDQSSDSSSLNAQSSIVWLP